MTEVTQARVLKSVLPLLVAAIISASHGLPAIADDGKAASEKEDAKKMNLPQGSPVRA